MFRKPMMLALAATLSLGAVALSTSTASAFRFAGGTGGMHFNGGARFGGLHVNSRPFVSGIAINRPMVNGIKINPWPKFGWNHHHHWWWGYGWRRPYWIAPVVATGGVATYAATTTGPATNNCTCLTKQYTEQGAVVFKDVCTNEMAMNPPANVSPAADAGPQMPQQPYTQPYQQGYLQAPAQAQ